MGVASSSINKQREHTHGSHVEYASAYAHVRNTLKFMTSFKNIHVGSLAKKVLLESSVQNYFWDEGRNK